MDYGRRGPNLFVVLLVVIACAIGVLQVVSPETLPLGPLWAKLQDSVKDGAPGTKSAPWPAPAAGDRATASASAQGAIAPIFDVVITSPDGELTAAGKGEPGWRVKLIDNDNTFQEMLIDDNGEWVVPSGVRLAFGDHTLWLVATDPQGGQRLESRRKISLSVTKRPSLVASAGQTAAGQTTGFTNASAVSSSSSDPSSGASQSGAARSASEAAAAKNCLTPTVKPGDTLWAMSQRCYGDGTKYDKIYKSNQPKIRDPNLIYPDQQLVLPQ